MNQQLDYINSLPPELHVHLLRFLGSLEKQALCEINPASKNLLSSHAHLVAKWDLSDSRLMTAKTLNAITRDFKKLITHLRLDFTPWITYSALQPALSRCENLVSNFWEIAWNRICVWPAWGPWGVSSICSHRSCHLRAACSALARSIARRLLLHS